MEPRSSNPWLNQHNSSKNFSKFSKIPNRGYVPTMSASPDMTRKDDREDG